MHDFFFSFYVFFVFILVLRATSLLVLGLCYVLPTPNKTLLRLNNNNLKRWGASCRLRMQLLNLQRMTLREWRLGKVFVSQRCICCCENRIVDIFDSEHLVDFLLRDDLIT